MQKFLKSAVTFILGAAAVGVAAKVAYDKRDDIKKSATGLGAAMKDFISKMTQPAPTFGDPKRMPAE